MQDLVITSASGLTVVLSRLGARVLDVRMSAHNASLICGHSNPQEYAADAYYMGATVGPIANRVRNGRFAVGGKEIQLPVNQNGHCLHSADLGIDKQIWNIAEQTADSVVFTLPNNDRIARVFGELHIAAKYSVQGDSLRIEYSASPERETYLNLTNHTYWNLNQDSADVRNHRFTLCANTVAEKDADDIPTGAVGLLTGDEGFSFRKLSRKLQPENVAAQQARSDGTIESQGEVDHHFIVNEPPNVDRTQLIALNKMLDVVSPSSGIKMSVSSSKPGFQLYSGHFLPPTLGAFSGFCVEPQYAPNAINLVEFFSPIVGPDRAYEHTILCELSST